MSNRAIGTTKILHDNVMLCFVFVMLTIVGVLLFDCLRNNDSVFKSDLCSISATFAGRRTRLIVVSKGSCEPSSNQRHW
jgi:hypothetical protein